MQSLITRMPPFVSFSAGILLQATTISPSDSLQPCLPVSLLPVAVCSLSPQPVPHTAHRVILNVTRASHSLVSHHTFPENQPPYHSRRDLSTGVTSTLMHLPPFKPPAPFGASKSCCTCKPHNPAIPSLVYIEQTRTHVSLKCCVQGYLQQRC